MSPSVPPVMLHFCCEMLTLTFLSNPTPAQKFGALNMTTALAPFIMRHKNVKGAMEQFVVRHVIPELSSPEGFLRSIVSAYLLISEMSTQTDELFVGLRDCVYVREIWSSMG